MWAYFQGCFLMQFMLISFCCEMNIMQVAESLTLVTNSLCIFTLLVSYQEAVEI